MINTLVKKVFGNHSDRKLKKYSKIVTETNKLSDQFKDYTQEQFQAKTKELQEKLAGGTEIDDIIPEAFAIVRQAASNVLGERHYDVQILGGMSLHDGQIAEMKTGEGKTLTSTLPVYLNALSGKGVHIVTVNDYLARRDSQWMGQVYNYLGLSVGLVLGGLNDEQRREAYGADITYGTNNEFGFDFLRDNMKFDIKDYVQRDHHFAIVDEVDSILVDEARTPLIISGPAESSTETYMAVDQQMYGLKREWRVSDSPEAPLVSKTKQIEEAEVKEYLKSLEDTEVVVAGDYTLDEKSRNIQLSENGVEKFEKRLKDMLKSGNLFDFENIEILHHINQALKARYVFKRDVDYVVQEGKVIIVDEFTGRLMEGRRFSDGLHQALEAKEHVPIERENQTLASITFQNYFRKYAKLAGMTGTAETEAEEFSKIYGLGVVVIPTNRPLARLDQSDIIYKTKGAKYRAIVEKVRELNAKQQPVLVGTASIESSEQLSAFLKQQKIPHTVLNAKYHEKEAEIITNAGQLGAVTIATNMAGRGTDIKLKAEVLEKGGLYILGTERHESRRIDNQLRGRSGRQGDAGESRFFLSLEDDLLRIFGGERIANLMNKLKIDEDEAIEHILITRAIENSQKKVEGHNFDIRKHLLEYDDVMNRQRDIIYSQRKEILGEVSDVLFEMSTEVLNSLLDQYCSEKNYDEWDLKGFEGELQSVFQLQVSLRGEDDGKLDEGKLQKIIQDKLQEAYKKKGEEFGEHKTMIERQILLELSDNLWKDHLLSMDHLKEGIGLRSYAQKQPLQEYKKEAFQLFGDLMNRISRECVTAYFHVKIVEPPKEVHSRMPDESEMEMIHGNLHQEEAKDNKKKKPKGVPRKKHVDIGRNDPCPCGSGKKYKNCHQKEYESAGA